MSIVTDLIALVRRRRREKRQARRKFVRTRRRWRRAMERLRIARRTTGPEAAVRWARERVGRTEIGGGNDAPWLRRELGPVGFYPGAAWCAFFTSAAIRAAGSDASASGYCPTLLAWARSSAHGYRMTDRPQVGALALFSFGKSEPQHVGICTGRGTETIEGNTSPGSGGSQNNGGGVYVRDRGRASWYIMPSYR